MDRIDEIIEAWQRELPDVVSPTTELEKRIMLLAAALTTATRNQLATFGLTVAEYDTLVALRRGGKPYRMKPSQLARELLLSSGGITNVVNELTNRGLTQRQPDIADGRATWVRLTGIGQALAEQALRACTVARAALFADLPSADVATTANALRYLCDVAHPRLATHRPVTTTPSGNS